MMNQEGHSRKTREIIGALFVYPIMIAVGIALSIFCFKNAMIEHTVHYRWILMYGYFFVIGSITLLLIFINTIFLCREIKKRTKKKLRHLFRDNDVMDFGDMQAWIMDRIWAIIFNVELEIWFVCALIFYSINKDFVRSAFFVFLSVINMKELVKQFGATGKTKLN